ncbi:hypothetical protein [Gemmatimonas sp.]
MRLTATLVHAVAAATMLATALVVPFSTEAGTPQRGRPASATALPTSPSQPDTAARVLVWAVDGLSYEAFVEAQRRGLFRQFSYAGRHVAPFPSMSHPAWTDITGANRLFGTKGTLRSVEANWFDLDAMRVADDPRQVFARQAAPFNYMRSFDWFYDPITEPLMYFKGDRLADRELADAEREVLERFTGDHHVVFLGAADAIAHTHLNGLHAYLRRLDAMLSRVADSLTARGGTPVRQFILSDHGNVGAFAEGAPERRLTPVSLDAALRSAALVRRDTGRLARPNEVSIVTLALASMVNVYFADLGKRRAFARAALRQRGVDLVTWLEVRGDDQVIVVTSADRGEAELRWRIDGHVHYRSVTGNPLLLPDSLISTNGQRRWVADSTMRAVSMPGPYPDAAFRLVRSASKAVENAPDLVVSLHDGFCWSGKLGRYVQMVRTHGALGARSTLGLVASTHMPVPPYVRSHEVLAVTGLTEHAIFHRIRAHAPQNARAVAESLLTAPRQVATGRDDDGPDAAFLRRVKPLTLSAEYFDFDILRAMTESLRSDSVQRAAQSRRIQRTRRTIDRTRVVDGVARHIDTLLALVDPLPSSIRGDSVAALLNRTEARVQAIPELAPLTSLRDIWGARRPGNRDSAYPLGETLRRATMAAYTMPFFLDAALDSPETDSVADPRDRAFAFRWHAHLRDSVRAIPHSALADSTLAPKLFGEIFAERELLRRVEGATVPLLYEAPVPAITVVYVPGIFGELFDDEIWRRGLRSVRERLGVRVVTALTDGRCSTSDNATRLLQQLRDDTRQRRARGYPTPRYVIVGYSKGGIDAAQALVRDSALTTSQVTALLTIATPHGGSPVAERTDLSDELLRLAVTTPRPASCDTARAVESLWPANRAAFWSSDGQRLAPLVPLYSLSLASDMREAHPWMKITKRIARFTEENDGVVARSAARFPDGVAAIHLGELRGDHIAARSASAFPQESALESALLTLNELGALDERAADSWRTTIAKAALQASHAKPAAAPAMTAGGPDARNGDSRRPRQSLPGGNAGWSAARTFRMNNLETLADGTVEDATAENLPLGIDMRCDQENMTAFREEYAFLYDAGNGGSENSEINGFSLGSVDSETGRACRLHTRRSAMKMTTVAFRFAPTAFPNLTMRVRVDRPVTGVAPDKGGRGKNDASIKLWYVLRDERPASKGRRLLFGYTWAGSDAKGAVPAADSLVEAGASRRRIAFSVLPEAWLVNIGGPAVEGVWTDIRRNFAADVRRAYPAIPLESLRVIAITVQSDSDDSRGETDVLLERLAMLPPAH